MTATRSTASLDHLVEAMLVRQALADATAEAARRAARPRITNMATGLVVGMLAACPLTYLLAFTAGTAAGW